MKIYKSCNCSGCRSVSSKVKKVHKKEAHKKFRMQGKLNPEEIIPISTGYKA